jgi:hypothetical protein
MAGSIKFSEAWRPEPPSRPRLRHDERGEALDQYAPEGAETEFPLTGRAVAEVASELLR